LRAWGRGGLHEDPCPNRHNVRLEVGKERREKAACAWRCMHSYCGRRPPTVVGVLAQQVRGPVDCATLALLPVASSNEGGGGSTWFEILAEFR
jgi:hypothetical protein